MGARNKGLVLAMESEDNAGEEMLVLPEVDEAQMDAEEASADVVEQVEEVEELEDNVEDAEADAETLEEIKGSMERSVEEGEGLTETAAEIAEVAVEAICARLGMPTGKIMPAVESFGSTGSRVTATKVCIESVADTISAIIAAVIKAVKVVSGKIAAFFLGLEANAGKMSKYIDEMLVKAKAIEDAKPKEEMLAKKGIAKAFSIDKKADASTAGKVLADSEVLMESVTDINGAISSTVMQSILAAAGGKEGKEGLSKAAGELKTKVDSSVNALKVISEVVDKTGENSEAKTVTSGYLAGGKTLEVKSTKVGDTIESVMVKVVASDKFEAAESVKALSKAEVIALLTEAKSLCAKIVAVTKNQNDLKGITKSLTKASDDMAKKLGKGLEGDEAAEFKYVLKYVRNTNSMIASLSGTLPGAAFGAVKAAGEYANASMANLKAEDAPADAGE